MASIKRYPLKSENGKARYSYKVSWRDKNGQSKGKSFSDKDYPAGTGGPLKAAKAFKGEVEAQLSSGRYVDPHKGKITFEEYAEQWMGTVKVAKSLNTAQSYQRRVNKVLDLLGPKRMNVIERSDIQEAINRVVEEDSAAYAGDIRTVVSMIFNSAVLDKVVMHSPCVSIVIPKETQPEVLPLVMSEIHRLSKALPKHLEAWPYVQAGLGLRTSEMLGMQLKFIDWEAKTYKVDAQEGQQLRTEGPCTPVYGPPKSKAGIRLLPIPQSVLYILRAHVEALGNNPHGVVFPRPDGGAYNRSTFSMVWTPAVKAAGVDQDTEPKQLRHTYASLLIAGGENPKVIQKRMGHSTITITFDTYGHLFPDSDEKTRAVIDDAFVDAP